MKSERYLVVPLILRRPLDMATSTSPYSDIEDGNKTQTLDAISSPNSSRLTTWLDSLMCGNPSNDDGVPVDLPPLDESRTYYLVSRSEDADIAYLVSCSEQQPPSLIFSSFPC